MNDSFHRGQAHAADVAADLMSETITLNGHDIPAVVGPLQSAHSMGAGGKVLEVSGPIFVRAAEWAAAGGAAGQVITLADGTKARIVSVTPQMGGVALDVGPENARGPTFF